MQPDVFSSQVKPKSSFIYYYGEDSVEVKDGVPDGDVLNVEPVIPARPR